MSEHERPAEQVEHVELDQVDSHGDRGPERAQGVLGRERRRAAMPDAENAAGGAMELDHEAPRAAGRTRRTHHQAARPTTTAWTTTIAAASFAVSCQKISG